VHKSSLAWLGSACNCSDCSDSAVALLFIPLHHNFTYELLLMTADHSLLVTSGPKYCLGGQIINGERNTFLRSDLPWTGLGNAAIYRVFVSGMSTSKSPIDKIGWLTMDTIHAGKLSVPLRRPRRNVLKLIQGPALLLFRAFFYPRPIVPPP
jgi:hypothetical protein